jgi:hypothetical protein
MADLLQEKITSAQQQLSASNPVASPLDNPAPPVDQFTLSTAKREREAKASTGDYLGAMWRQDSFVDGLMAKIAGDQMPKDPNYAPYADEAHWKELTTGIPEQFHPEFYNATSAANALFIRSRLLDKLTDLENLGDLNKLGTVGRFAFNMVEPTQLLAGVASGGIYTAARGVKGVAGAIKASTTARALEPGAAKLAAVERAAAGLEAAAVAEGSKKALAISLGVAGAGQAVFEKLRQSVNFEDDTAAVLEASLMGIAFASPFVGLKAREMRRLSGAAGEERKLLAAVREMHDNPNLRFDDLSPETRSTFAKYEERLKAIEDVEAGRKGPADDIEANPKPALSKMSEDIKKAFSDIEAARASVRDKELNELWTESHMKKGQDQADMQAIIDKVNGEKLMSPMELAFMKAQIKKESLKRSTAPTSPSSDVSGVSSKVPPEAALGPSKAAPEVSAKVEKPAPVKGPVDNPTDVIGEDVTWRSDDGFESGTVIRSSQNGSLLVENHATGEKVSIRRHELDQDSPLYEGAPVPTGFLPGSVGSAQVLPIASSGIDRTAKAEVMVGNIKVPIRYDIYAVLNGQPNKVLQELGHLLVKDPIGNSKYDAQGWAASERKSHYVKTIGGMFHREAREAFNEAAKARGLGLGAKLKFHTEFYENVSRVTRGDTDVIAANLDIAAQYQRAAKAMRTVYDKMAEEAKKAGVQGAENLQTGGQYVNRIWQPDHIRQAISRYGENQVLEALAAASPVWRNSIDKARTFLNAVRKLEFSHMAQDMVLHAHDMGHLRGELAKANLSPDEIDSIVDTMFQVKKTEADAGNAGNLKFRLDLDENYTHTMRDGSSFRIADLFENDSRVLVDRYMSSMGGHTSMAWKGFKSRAEFEARLRKADEEHLEKGSLSEDGARFTRSKQLVQDMYDHITGRPMSTQTFNRGDRILAAVRAYSRSTFLGQLGIAAAFELKNAMALATMRSAMMHMPSFSETIHAFKTGRIANEELARDIEQIAGFGLEQAASYARKNEFSEFTVDKGLTQFEKFGNQASHVVDVVSGNNFFTSFTRQKAAAMMIQKHMDMATGKLKLDAPKRERLVGQGIDDDMIDSVLTHLKEFTVTDSKGRVEEVDWEGWQQKHPQTYDNWQRALFREVRDAIQDHDIGETMPWMHTTVGKIIAELKTFILVAHAKQFLKNVHYMDRQTMMVWTLGFVGDALAYSLQSSVNYAHDSEKLDKMLAPERIAKAALARMSSAGIVPMLFETPYKMATGQRFFGNGSTTNTDNRDLFTTPSMALGQKLYSSAQAGANFALSPLNGSVFTQQDAKNLGGILPGGNTWGVRNVIDAMSSSLPKHEAK